MLNMPLFKSFLRPATTATIATSSPGVPERCMNDEGCVCDTGSQIHLKPTNAMATNGDHKQNGNVGNLSLKTTTNKKQLEICQNSRKSSSLGIWVSTIHFQLPCHTHYIVPAFVWEEKAYREDLLWGAIGFLNRGGSWNSSCHQPQIFTGQTLKNLQIIRSTDVVTIVFQA